MMDQNGNSTNKNQNLLKVGGIAFGFVFILWLACLVTVSLVGNWQDKAGPFGDSFGTLNALFSGLAFAGIIVTLFLQRKELGYQREELEATRAELKRSATAQEETQKMLTRQIYLSALASSANAHSSMVQAFSSNPKLEHQNELSQKAKELDKILEKFEEMYKELEGKQERNFADSGRH